jgi:TolB-like protein
MFVLFQPHISFAYEKEIRDLSAALSDNIAKSGKNRIAVVDFTDLQGNVTELGRFIAEEFAVALLGTGKGFEIVDRTHLQALLKEHKLSTTGLIDPATAQKLGQIAGVDALVTGTITPFGESVRLSVKILDAKSAKLIGANVGNIPATEAIKSLLESGIQSSGITSTGYKQPKPQLKAQQVVETRGFTIALQKSKRSGDSVTCYFMITNSQKDRDFILNGESSRIFDDLGNEYTGGSAQVGKVIHRWGASSTLVVNIPTKASINFEKIESQAGLITLIELLCWESSKSQEFKVQFRNVPFSK